MQPSEDQSPRYRDTSGHIFVLVMTALLTVGFVAFAIPVIAGIMKF